MRTENRIAQAATIMMVGSLGSSLLGFLREALIASYFGGRLDTDAYLAGCIIPSIFLTVVATAISTCFIPVYTQYITRGQDKEAWELATIFGTLIFLVSAALIVFGEAIAPVAVRLLVPNFPERGMPLAVQQTQLMLPLILFTCWSAMASGILQSCRAFVSSALVGVVSNLCIISGMILFGARLGIATLAVGNVVGAAAGLMWQMPDLLRRVHFQRPSLRLSHPGVKQIGLLMVPILVGSGLGQINLIVDRMLASGMTVGSISALNFSSRLMLMPCAIFGGAILSAVYPALSRYATQGDHATLARTVETGLNMGNLILVPAAVGLMVLRVPIVRLLFEHGKFDAGATQATAGALFYFSIGLFAMAGRDLLSRVCYAKNDTRTPLWNSAVAVGVNVFASVLLSRTMAHYGLALANSLASIVSMLLLLIAMRRKLPQLQYRVIGGTFLRIVLAAGAMGWVCTQVWQTLAGWGFDRGNIPLLQGVGISIGCSLLAYLVAAWVLEIEEVRRVRTFGQETARRVLRSVTKTS